VIIFYHGNPTTKKMKKARNYCPFLEHRAEYTPDTIRNSEFQYFLDNGAFTSDFKPNEWINTLDRIKSSDIKEPDFVVLPDVFNDAEATHQKHLEFVNEVRLRGFNFYYVAQPGERDLMNNLQHIVYRALSLGAEGIFVGGSWHKPRVVSKLLDMTDRKDLKVHVGMPKNLLWVVNTEVDSFDTANIVRNQSWSKLRSLQSKIEEQKPITAF